MKRILSFLLLLLTILPDSAFHTMLFLMLLAWVWREEVKQYADRKGRYLYGTLWGILWSVTLLLMPRPFALPTDRIQMIHFNSKGETVSAPIGHWIFNLIFPEETLCALGCAIPLTPLKTMVPVGNSIMDDYYHELRSGGLLKIRKAYHNLDAALESPLSAAITQAFCQHLGDKHRSAYIIRPKHFDSQKEYPVLFLHMDC